MRYVTRKRFMLFAPAWFLMRIASPCTRAAGGLRFRVDQRPVELGKCGKLTSRCWYGNEPSPVAVNAAPSLLRRRLVCGQTTLRDARGYRYDRNAQSWVPDNAAGTTGGSNRR